MTDILQDFEFQRSYLEDLVVDEAEGRISGFVQWMQDNPIIEPIISELSEKPIAKEILKNADRRNPPKASTPEEIAAVGLEIMLECRGGEELWDVAYKYGVHPSYPSNSSQDRIDEVMKRYINPAINYIYRKLENATKREKLFLQGNSLSQPPLGITESLTAFSHDYPEVRRNAFIMMKYGETPAHEEIITSIKTTLNKYGISALRADDKQYHDDLFPNVQTYIYGCHFGIAVFERLENNDINPNVSLEVGYMHALKKSVCYLKDKTLGKLQTDLVGKLYREFDPQDPEGTIPDQLERWLKDKDIINI